MDEARADDGDPLPLRDLMPPELTAQAGPASSEVPDLDLSEEVFSDPPPATEGEPQASEPDDADPAESEPPGEPEGS